MKHQYETIFILAPTLTEKETTEVIRYYAEFFDSNDAERTAFEEWGRKRLAYPVKDFNEGYYYRVDFKCENEFIEKLQLQYNADDNVIKHIIVKHNDMPVKKYDRDDAISEQSSRTPTTDTASPTVQPEVNALDVMLGFDHYKK